MEKVTLKLFEFYNLEAELSGVVNQQTGEAISKGLLNERIKLTTKYWLTDLLKKVTEEKKSVENLKDDLIKKYGKESEGGFSIPMYIDVETNENEEVVSKKVNPDFLSFQNEFNILLQEERELEYRPLTLSDFESIESEGNYPVLFKLLQVND